MTLPEVAIKVTLAVDSAGVVPTSFCTLLVLGGNGNNRVDEICAFFPAIVLALGEKLECASLRCRIGANASDDGGIDAVGCAVAGAFVAYVP
ncbi:hypothetical protein ABVK25_010503 [Lepraria finkii]|uniref:Uncharacterized protein n=1 Tax=Lepraria finkii TaxID=1340010 RepID=A0ABR4AWN9_9LECA